MTRADLDAADAGFQVERVHERDARGTGAAACGAGAPARRCRPRALRPAGSIGTPAATSFSCQVLDRADPVVQVRLLDHLLETARDRLEVVARETAVGGEALGQDQQVRGSARPTRRRSAPGSRRCWRGRPSWPTSCSRRRAQNISRAICFGVLSAWPASRGLTNQAFSAKRQASRKKGLPKRSHRRAHAAQVLERDRLPAAGVVRHGDHHERHALAVLRRACARAPPRSTLPLNGCDQRRHAPLGDHQVARLGLLDLDVGARRVEVVVVRDHVARLQHGVEQDPLGGAALVRRDHVAEARQVLDHVAGSGRTSGCPRRTRRPA